MLSKWHRDSFDTTDADQPRLNEHYRVNNIL